MSKRILVTGGAGYIGSHTCKELARQGYEVVVFDNLELGHKENLRFGDFFQGDLRSPADIAAVFAKYAFDGVIHFAAYASVPDSVANPAKYFQNNIVGGLNLLEGMRAAGVSKIVFSSSAAVYGEPEESPITEGSRKQPTNPYGWTKLQFEQILHAYDVAYGFKSVCLRYFCAAGADPEGELGENHEPETHVIPLAILTALGKRESFKIFGTDYPTPDGTGVRDFIHVTDLADFHVASLDYLWKGGESDAFNCGTKTGFSVREIADTVKKVTGNEFSVIEEKRRPGDPAILVADPSRLEQVLGCKARHSDLETIVRTGHAWLAK
jgi:UDP-glucose 4-epimerase